MVRSFGDQILDVVEKQHIYKKNIMTEENSSSNDISCVENNIPDDAEIISVNDFLSSDEIVLFSQEPKRGGEGKKTDRNKKRHDL